MCLEYFELSLKSVLNRNFDIVIQRARTEKMLKVLKRLRSQSWTRDEDSRKPLVNNMASQFTERVAGDSRTQISSLNSTDQSKEDPNGHSVDFEAEGQNALSVLRDVLLRDVGSQEPMQAAEQITRWAKLNGVTPERKEGNYSEAWLREYHKTVEQSVKKHFPSLPAEGSTEASLQTGQYLKLAMSLIRSEVLGLVPILEDSGLLNILIDSYNCRLFAELDLLTDRSSSVKEIFFLLEWVKQTYFSHDLKGSPNIQDSVLRISDPLLLSYWCEKAKQKLLTLLLDYISSILQNILRGSEAPCDYSSEENLIKVHLDVVQCLDAVLQRSKTLSLTLMTGVQRLCCDQLHSFVERYLNVEKIHLESQNSDETYPLHLFRIFDTCWHLRSYALNIVDQNNKTDSSTLLMLENMEDQVSFRLKQWLGGLAEVHLKKYFKERDIHINNLMDLLQKMLAPLPQGEQGERTKQHFVNAAYESVTRAYLRCLMQRKCGQLERRWGDIYKMMMNDAELFHSTFKRLSVGDDKQKLFLLMMGEILRCTDVDSLRLICAGLYTHFPKKSEEFLAALLKWRKGLSRRQRKEILSVSQEACQLEGQITRRGLKYWSCCLCCT